MTDSQPPDPPDLIARLQAAAEQAAARAWCPYSRFRVGAAVLTSEGAIFAGCNVENASSGLTVCAERNAVAAAVAAGQPRLTAVLIYTPTDHPTAPCGACRQVIAEFGPAARIISVCDGPDRLETTLNELLPHLFDAGSLTATGRQQPAVSNQ